MPPVDRPTKTKTVDPTLDDLMSPRMDQPLTTTASKEKISTVRAAEPELNRATSAQTRAALRGITPTDQMSDMISRLRNIDDDGMSDEEAARIAGLTHDPAQTVVDVRPIIPENLPDVIHTDIATISGDLIASDQVNPKWHTIATLPGWMQRAIRSMGGQLFKMFTTTPQQDIVTIANVNNQGPNTSLEVNSVLAWLNKNAENLGSVDIDFSQIMPGYKPESMEFRTGQTRFHVVKDFAGYYIYAYPEEDAVSFSAQPALTSDDDEYDDYGAPKKLLREVTMNKKPLTEQADDLLRIKQLAGLTVLTESALINEHATLKNNTKNFTESLVESYLFERSTLLNILDPSGYRYWASKGGDEPEDEETVKARQANLATKGQAAAKRRGREWKEPTAVDVSAASSAKALAKWLHKYDNVSATAEWDQVAKGADRIYMMLFKASPDHFMVIKGPRGVAAVRPDLKDFQAKVSSSQSRGKTYNPERDTKLKYQVVAFSEGMRVDNMLIPDEYETEVDPDTGKEKVKTEVVPHPTRAGKTYERPVVKVDHSAERRRGGLNPLAPATVVTMVRAGRPYTPELTQNFFDLLKSAIGRDVKGSDLELYISSSRAGGLKGDAAKAWIGKYQAGKIPSKGELISDPEKGEIVATPGKPVRVWDPQSQRWIMSTTVPGERLPGATERELAAKRQETPPFTPGKFITKEPGKDIAQSLSPLLVKLLQRKMGEMQKMAMRYTEGGNRKEASKLLDKMDKVDQMQIALDSSKPNWQSMPLRKLTAIANDTVNSYTTPETRNQTIAELMRRRPQAMKEFLYNFLDKVDDTSVFNSWY